MPLFDSENTGEHLRAADGQIGYQGTLQWEWRRTNDYFTRAGVLKGLRKGDIAGRQRTAERVAETEGTCPAGLEKGLGAFYILFAKGIIKIINKKTPLVLEGIKRLKETVKRDSGALSAKCVCVYVCI